MLSTRCLSVLSVTLVYCGQTVGWIKMKNGTQVGLGPGHIVLDGDPAPPPQRGTAPFPIFGPYLLRPNGRMEQDATWYGGRLRSRRLCVRWRPLSSLPKKGAEPPIFSPCLLRPNGCMDQGATWYGDRTRPRRHCVTWGPSSPPQKGGGAPPQFSAHVYCGQTAGWIKMALGTEVGLGPGNIVLDGHPAPLPIKGAMLPSFRPTSIVAKRLDGSRRHLVRK